MKKVVILDAVLAVLLIALLVFAVFYLDIPARLTQAEVPQTEETLPVTEPPTEEPTEPPTEPEPTEPPFQMEKLAVWSEYLYGRKITAGEYFVYDLDQERFLTITGSPEDKLYPASITKLYTAYVALQYMDPDEKITVGSEIWMVDEDSSVAEIQVGDVLTVRQLVAGMLLPSGNDATQTLTVAAGRKLAEDPELSMYAAVQRFIEQMNADAEGLGLTGSHFATVDGIHSSNHYFSMGDMVTVGKLAMSNEVIAQCVATHQQTVALSEERSLEWENTNMLMKEGSRYYCVYITGLKTGFTTPAGNCLLSSVTVDGRNLLIGVFKCTYPEDRFADTLLLLLRTLGEPVDAPVPATEPPTEPATEPPTQAPTEASATS